MRLEKKYTRALCSQRREGSNECCPLLCSMQLDVGVWYSRCIVCSLYLVLTRNLACQLQNTLLIQRIKYIVQALCFDDFQVFFGHLKTDQLGKESKYPCHIYANPFSPSICPVLVLTLYFSACFNSLVNADSYLFPRRDQEDCFSRLLSRLLDAHVADLEPLGYQRMDISTHSIRKGAVSYLASTPDGPQAASVCIHAGWMMGKV